MKFGTHTGWRGGRGLPSLIALLTLSSHPKWPPAAILSKSFKKTKVAYRSEMARNAIESYLRTSKMAAGGHFVKNFKK